MADGVNPSDIKKAQEKVFNSDEPPSGIQGAGAADQPYDAGNQVEQASVNEPVAGDQGAGTADKPYDQGNQAEQSSMNIIDELSRTKTKEEIAAKKQKRRQSPHASGQETPEINVADHEHEPQSRGRDQTASVTASSAPAGTDTSKLAPKTRPQFERSMSPGQLDDGSHVRCSGESGHAYSPPGALGKLKGKLHIGSH